MMRRIFLFILLVFPALVQGQQHALYSNYLFNLFVVNPAYAGAADALTVGAAYRSQWVGFEGAPQTQTFTAHSPMFGKEMALGIMVQNDVIGPRQMSTASLAYSYKFTLRPGEYLSFGLRGGMLHHNLDPNGLEYAQTGDPMAFASPGSHMGVNFDFGAMYRTRRSFVGVSVLNLNNPRYNSQELQDARLDAVLNIVAGKVWALSDKVDIKPSALYRQGMNGPALIDLNLGVLLHNALWITSTYRHGFGMVWSAQYQVMGRMHIGYAYDWALNGLMAKQSGSHELFLSYDFHVYGTKAKTPRYF